MTVRPDEILSNIDLVPGKYIMSCGWVCGHRGGDCINRKKRKEHVPCAQQFFIVSKYLRAQAKIKEK